MDKEKLSKYIGKPIVETDNQHIREWCYASVGDIPNQIDRSKSREEQARAAMSDGVTAKMLEGTRPVIPFDELLESKMRRKGYPKKKQWKTSFRQHQKPMLMSTRNSDCKEE